MSSKDLITRRDLIAFGARAAILPFALSAGCGFRRKPTRRPNIIFILIDTLRADRLGCYGYRRAVSPTMDAIAAEGVVFERPIAPAPWTQPSMASLFCGYYAGVHKVVDYGLADRMRLGKTKMVAVFDNAFTTLAEVLQKNGYATAAFLGNPLLSVGYGFAQGFDHYADMDARPKIPKGQKHRADILNKEALEWLGNRDKEKPFFLYLHYMDVHGAYYARDEFVKPLMAEVEAMESRHKLTAAEKDRMGYIGKSTAGEIAGRYKHLSDFREFWSALYDAGIRETDHHIAQLARDLEKIGLWGDTYVIITADHGEQLCEKGGWSHGNSLYDTELFVPMILRRPGALPAGRRVGGTVRLIDLMPTIIEHLDLPEVEGIQGRSLASDIEDGSVSQDLLAFSEGVKFRPGYWAAYFNDWKVIVDERQRRAEFYNIAQDRRERQNIGIDNSERVKTLVGMGRKQMQANMELGAETRVRDVAVTPKQYERLKSLGYVE